MSDLTPERRAELRELAEDADDINGWATEDYYDEDDECSAHLVSTGEARQFRIALGMQEWNAAYIAAAQPAVLTALLDAADERDRLAAAIERVRALAEWHETKAMKARRFRPEIDGENRVMDKTAEVHDDAARRVLLALDGTEGPTT